MRRAFCLKFSACGAIDRAAAKRRASRPAPERIERTKPAQARTWRQRPARAPGSRSRPLTRAVHNGRPHDAHARSATSSKAVFMHDIGPRHVHYSPAENTCGLAAFVRECVDAGMKLRRRCQCESGADDRRTRLLNLQRRRWALHPTDFGQHGVWRQPFAALKRARRQKRGERRRNERDQKRQFLTGMHRRLPTE
jgi:hypothetical protein